MSTHEGVTPTTTVSCCNLDADSSSTRVPSDVSAATGAAARPRRRMRRLLLGAAGMLLLLIPASALAGERFGDVSGGGHAPAIGWVADVGVTQGCDDGGNYCPSDPVTRAQMASFMQRLAGQADGIPPSVNAATLDGFTLDDLTATIDAAVTSAIDDTLTDVVDLQDDNRQLRDQLSALDAQMAGAHDQIAMLENTVNSLETQLDAVQVALPAAQAQIRTVQNRVGPLEETLDGVARDRDTLVFSGMDVRIVNGQGGTRSTNGLGNLILGYNESRTSAPTEPSEHSGSHNLVMGWGTHYRSYGAIVAGVFNTSDAPFGSIIGGQNNTAVGNGSMMVGGSSNLASGLHSVVLGGQYNAASAANATVTGGESNTASGRGASVSGGLDNTASGLHSSVLGGTNNTASSNGAVWPSP